MNDIKAYLRIALTLILYDLRNESGITNALIMS